MTTRISVLKFLRNLVAGTVLGGLGLGILGFLFAGGQGFINLARLGLIIGFVGSFSLGFTTFSVLHIFTECVQKYGSWWFKKESENAGSFDKQED